MRAYLKAFLFNIIVMSIERNYMTIQGWMITSLNLSGNNLLTFALIFGFCQDEETEFKGSINYICKWLNCSRPTAIKALNSLVESNLIKKRKEVVSGVTFNRYSINLQVVKKLYLGSKESLQGGGKETLLGGSKETLPNNIFLDTIIEDKDKDKNIPELSEFLEYAKSVYENDLGLKYSNYEFSLESKYQSWKDAKWKDGNGKPILKWKTKLRNTIPHLKEMAKASNEPKKWKVL